MSDCLCLWVDCLPLTISMCSLAQSYVNSCNMLCWDNRHAVIHKCNLFATSLSLWIDPKNKPMLLTSSANIDWSNLYSALYKNYFSVTRSRGEGRSRVGKRGIKDSVDGPATVLYRVRWRCLHLDWLIDVGQGLRNLSPPSGCRVAGRVFTKAMEQGAER